MTAAVAAAALDYVVNVVLHGAVTVDVGCVVLTLPAIAAQGTQQMALVAVFAGALSLLLIMMLSMLSM